MTTFSLSIMVSAYASASSNTTPRATRLLREDSVAHNTLATFVGTFLFSIVGIIGLAVGVYNGKGRVILFATTLIVLAVITIMLLRWIEQLGTFGRVGNTIHRIEAASLPAAKLKPSIGTRSHSSSWSSTCQRSRLSSDRSSAIFFSFGFKVFPTRHQRRRTGKPRHVLTLVKLGNAARVLRIVQTYQDERGEVKSSLPTVRRSW